MFENLTPTYILTLDMFLGSVIWNSSGSSITGYALSSSEFASLHDVYQGLDEEENCHKEG